MKASLKPSGVITENHSVISVEQDGISISSAVDTARLAAKYASQLSNEYHSLIHRHLARADPKIAGRFHSLITELTTMTDATFKNIRYGKNENSQH